MARYVVLMNWTDQGIKSVKESPSRLDAARETGKKHGVEIEDVYLTIGVYDLVMTIKADDHKAMAKFLLAQGSAGNVRTVTLKAFSEDNYREIIAGA